MRPRDEVPPLPGSPGACGRVFGGRLKQLIGKGNSVIIDSLLHSIRGAGCAERAPVGVFDRFRSGHAAPGTTDLTIDAPIAFVLERFHRTGIAFAG